MSFPKTPEAISAGWLSEVLESRVAEFSIEPCGEGRGFMARVVRIRISYANAADGPATLVAKFSLLGDSEHLRRQRESAAWPNLLRRAEREVLFYDRLGEDEVLARCFFAAADLDEPCFLVLLEDVKGRPGDILRTCEHAQVEGLVRALAKFHARFWESDDLERIDWMPRYGSNAKSSSRMFRKRATRFLDRFSSRLDARVIDLVEALVPNYAKVMEKFAASPRTVIHGDLHADNIVFASDGPRILDWQTVAIGHWSFDLALFLNDAVPAEQRIDSDPELLKIYAESLSDFGVDRSHDALLEDLRWGALLIFGTTVLWLAHVDLESTSGRERVLIDRALNHGPAFRNALLYESVDLILG